MLVDRFGPRNLLAASLLLTAASQLATAATTTVGPLFAWQVAGGLAAGVQQSALFSAVTESIPRARMGRAMGWLTLSMQSGFFLGPALAGLALRWIDLRADIAVTTALLLFSVPGALLASQTRQQAGRGLSLRSPLLALARQPAFLPTAIGLVGITLTWGTIGAYLPVFGKESLKLPEYQVGYLLALQALVNAASRIPAGRLVDRVRERWPIVVGGGAGWSVAMIVLGHTTGFFWPAVVLGVGTPLMATAFVAMGVVFADLSHSSTRGVTMGAYGTLLFLGLSLGPLVFGPIVQRSYAGGFTACAAAAVLLLIVMGLLQDQVRRRSAEARPGDSETRAAAARHV